MGRIIINTDGGSRGNPGPSGIGVVIHNEENKIIAKYKEYIGETTNNVAEYKALILGLTKVRDFECREILCRLDSELVVKQLNGEYKVKDGNLRILYEEVRSLTFFKPVTFEHVRREYNGAADELVNQAIDEAGFRRY